MKTPAQADVRRWSDEVARDPKSLAFLPLARAYRKLGLRDAALQLCLRGLEAHPAHIEAHSLLALLYLEAGEHTRAADEWSMVLRIDPDNFDALRGLGFCLLEQDQLSRARQMLERAALQRPGDNTVQEALRMLGTRQELAAEGLTRAHGGFTADDPWSAAEAEQQAGSTPAAPPANLAPPRAPQSGPASHPAAQRAAPQQPVRAPLSVSTDPTQLFDDLLGAGPLLGALLVDAQGLVLAGRLGEGVGGDAEVLGAVVGGAIGEAARTAQHLALGNWRGILLEAEHALLHLAPVGESAIVVLAARRNTPAGWMMRTASAAVERAARYAEQYQ
jgi:predicted regulator of Ras-like GTPase activity (Roadblock/LC7/MglB family)